MEPSLSDIIIKHRPSVEIVPSRHFDTEMQNIDCKIDLIQKQLDDLDKENKLILEKETFILQNLKFRRNRIIVNKRDDSPSSEIFHSFENIELDDHDKVSIGSADLLLDEDSSEVSEDGKEDQEVDELEEEVEAVARKKPQESLKSMLKSFLAP